MGHTCSQSFRRLRKENNELKPVLYSEPLSGTQKGKKKENECGWQSFSQTNDEKLKIHVIKRG